MSPSLVLWLSVAAGLAAIVYGPLSVSWINAQSAGTARMQEIAAAVREGLSFDFGLRYARAGGDPVHELRLGLTWDFSFGKER